MADFKKRSEEIEIMDDLDCHGEVVDQTLRELEVINKLLGGNYVTLNGIGKLLKKTKPANTVSVADLGCGGGDLLKLISVWGTRKNIKLKLTGIDANPNIIHFAKNNSTAFTAISYEAIDIFSDTFKTRSYDVIAGTLFFHHFSNEQLVDFFRQLKGQAQLGIVINDIHRNWMAYYSIKILTRVFSKSAMVKYDAPLSVLRAFHKNDWIDILEKAAIKNYSIKWMWAFRWQIVINTSAS